jgi:FAD/FMN-containing dehydrogenase
MAVLRVITNELSERVLDQSAIDAFKSNFRGAILCPDDAGYDEARKLYNGMIDRRPAIIARCTGVADVINGVNFAGAHNVLLSVRGGGHSVAGNALCDGGLVIDLSVMKGIRADPVTRTVRAQAGVTWGELDRETQAFGLATTGGIYSGTGIAGLTLGGGMGYLNRKYGLACDNLISADVVTAEGRLLTANANENADLFWALRGGGGNFGVVTSFEYRLHPVGPVLGGMSIYPLEQAKKVLRFYRKFSTTAPNELRVDAVVGALPPGPGVAIIVCWCGPIEQGERALEPLRRFAPPMASTIGVVPYATVQTLLDAALPSGDFHYWKSNFFKDLSDSATDALVDSVSELPASQSRVASMVALEHLGGAVGRIAPQETAFSHRGAEHSFLVLSVWRDRAESEQHLKWARKVWEAMRPFLAEGVYVNYLGDDEAGGRVASAYGENYNRLAAIKKKYDPKNVFRINQNIKPAA